MRQTVEKTKTHRHTGHRKRLRERFLRSGSDGLHDYELVELLLSYVIPRRDVKDDAKALLERFGSISKMMDAPEEELTKEKGMTENSAALFKLVKVLCKEYLSEKMEGKDALSCPKAVCDFARMALGGKTDEHCMLIYLNAKNQVIGHEKMSEGTIDHAIVYPRGVIKKAMKRNAAGIILVHNHPSDVPTPSQADVEMTKTLFDAAKTMGVALLDHIIVTKYDYLSFVEKGLIK